LIKNFFAKKDKFFSLPIPIYLSLAKTPWSVTTSGVPSLIFATTLGNPEKPAAVAWLKSTSGTST